MRASWFTDSISSLRPHVEDKNTNPTCGGSTHHLITSQRAPPNTPLHGGGDSVCEFWRDTNIQTTASCYNKTAWTGRLTHRPLSPTAPEPGIPRSRCQQNQVLERVLFIR